MNITFSSLALAASVLVCGAASAHVVLEQPSAAAGSSYRAVFRVGHACGDGMSTTGITVRIPAGVQGAKPMPKPGWALAVKTGALAVPYTSHGKQVETDVTEIAWSAGSRDAALPEAHYDEFVLRATLPAAPGALWFKVTQTCDDAGRVVRKEWAETPAEGTSTRGLASPAALLQVEPAGGAAPAAPVAPASAAGAHAHH